MRNRHDPSVTRHRLHRNATIGAMLFASATIAVASAANHPPTRVLRYAPASLATAQGIAALYERIVEAAKAVCPPYLRGPISFLPAQTLVRECRRTAVDNAVRQIGNRRLASIEALRKGRS